MSLNPFNYDYQWAVIVAFVAAVIALYGSFRANKIAERNISASIDMQFIQIEEKRIGALRDALSDFNSSVFQLIVDKHYTAKDFADITRSSNQVDLLMNTDDPDYKTISDLMHEMIVHARKKVADRNNLNVETEERSPSVEFIKCAQRILKRESDRLRSDIEKYNAKNK